jgi:thymidylate synthase
MRSEPFLPKSKNLSVAWAEVFLKLMDSGVDRLTPAIVTVSDLDDHGVPHENSVIRNRLDQELGVRGCYSCHTVANTIFPESLWNPVADNNAKTLFERYDRIWPRVKRYRQNTLGVYFRRLTAFPPKERGRPGEAINQLQHIIDTYNRGNHRVSALQASIFDPTQDHTHRRQQGFPCLQQVAFVPVDGTGLCVTGFYATQYIFERAYGNYLGLCRLGRFMAAQMGLSFIQMTCVAAVARRSDPGTSKGSLQPLASDLGQILADARRKNI